MAAGLGTSAVVHLRSFATGAALLAAALTLGGCSSTNLSTFLADNIPQWAGGLPKDAPPRPDDPRYAEFYKAQIAARQQSIEQQRLADAKAREQDARIDSAQVDAGVLERSHSARSVVHERKAAPVLAAPAPAAFETEAVPHDAFSLTGRALY
jgi:hypothetical protein